MTDMHHRRFDDATLRNAQLVLDPHSLEGLCTSPPAKEMVLVIEGEYHLSEEAEALRCSLCPQHTHHWNGFVVRTDEGSRHLIGSVCGPKYLGITFRLAENAHKEHVTRKSNLLRLDAVLGQFDHFLAQCDAVLFSARVKSLSEQSRAFRATAGDAFYRLRALVMRGAVLTENVMVRDFEAEKQREEATSNNKDKQPIYRPQTQAIGPLAGVGFLDAERLRETVFAFKRGLRELKSALSGDINELPTLKLVKTLRASAEAHEAANAAIASINSADAFFSSTNLDRLQRWSKGEAAEEIATRQGGLSVRAAGKPSVVIAAPSGDPVPPLSPFPPLG